MTDALIIMSHNLIASITNLKNNVNKLYSAPNEIMLVGNSNNMFACVDMYEQNINAKFVIFMMYYI